MMVMKTSRRLGPPGRMMDLHMMLQLILQTQPPTKQRRNIPIFPERHHKTEQRRGGIHVQFPVTYTIPLHMYPILQITQKTGPPAHSPSAPAPLAAPAPAAAAPQ